MRKSLRSPTAFLLQAMLGVAMAVVATAVLSVNSLAMSTETAKAKRPADTEFGLGPRGRLGGAAAVLRDEFNCRSKWSEATLADVRDHYNRAPVAPAGQSELEPLGLQALELRQLEAFLRSLSAPPRVAVELPR